MSEMRPIEDMLKWFDHLRTMYSFMDVVLEHGRWFFGRANVDDFDIAAAWKKTNKPKDGACFYNAQKFCTDVGYSYWEGYFLIRGLPIHHAWNVMDDGRVIDFTLEEALEKAKLEYEDDDTVPLYYGVNVPSSFIIAQVIGSSRGEPIAEPYFDQTKEMP